MTVLEDLEDSIAFLRMFQCVIEHSYRQANFLSDCSWRKVQDRNNAQNEFG